MGSNVLLSNSIKTESCKRTTYRSSWVLVVTVRTVRTVSFLLMVGTENHELSRSNLNFDSIRYRYMKLFARNKENPICRARRCVDPLLFVAINSPDPTRKKERSHFSPVVFHTGVQGRGSTKPFRGRPPSPRHSKRYPN